MSENNKNNKQNDPNSWSNRELGVLWKKTTAQGEMFSGSIKNKAGEDVRIVIFSNKFKEKDNHPDFRIYRDLPRDNNSAPAPKKSPPKVENKPVQNQNTQPEEEFV